MKIQYVSDVHCEHHQDLGIEWAQSIPVVGDVLVLAGDIATWRSIVSVLSIICERFPQVIFVAGNHEYWGSDRGSVHNNLYKVGRKYSNFHWLKDSFVTIQGQKFYGSTLWWSCDNPFKAFAIRGEINDFDMIRGYRKWVNQVNYNSKERIKGLFLSGELQDSILVTHHAPTWASWYAVHDGGWSSNRQPLLSDEAYYNKGLEYLFEERVIKAAIHGHTHDPASYFHHGVPVRNCPHGYSPIPDPDKFGIISI